MLGGHKKYGTLVTCLHQLQSMIDVLLTRQVPVFNWVTLGQMVWCMGLGAQKLGSTGVGNHGFIETCPTWVTMVVFVDSVQHKGLW